jgi:hypothetical protein
LLENLKIRINFILFYFIFNFLILHHWVASGDFSSSS